jgi:hypothetical protein
MYECNKNPAPNPKNRQQKKSKKKGNKAKINYALKAMKGNFGIKNGSKKSKIKKGGQLLL